MELRPFLAIAFIFCCLPKLLYAEEILVSLQIQPNQRDRFEQIFELFSLETGIHVKSLVATDLAYKEKVPVWLLEGKGTPDVMFWSASKRLYQYAEKDLLLPITELWDEQHYDDQFFPFKAGVTYNGEIYAVPFAHYHWGIFFRKSMLRPYGGVPDDWKSFLAIMSRMKEDGVIPIGIGTKQNWPAAAWFDYLDLRMNGLKFHLDLLNGEISFHDKRVQRVLLEWKKLIDRGFYNSDNKAYNWDEVLPLFYRKRIGFLLLGNFVASKWPTGGGAFEDIVPDIGFMPFPTIDENLPFYENAPTDIFMIPKSTTKVEEAQSFIRFIARADVQTILSEGLGYLPANQNSLVGGGRLMKEGVKLINRASGLSQYFDRDTHPDFDKLATPLLADFINTGDVEDLTIKLESARLEVFGESLEP